jgi:hypothetical protein
MTTGPAISTPVDGVVRRGDRRASDQRAAVRADVDRRDAAQVDEDQRAAVRDDALRRGVSVGWPTHAGARGPRGSWSRDALEW